NMKMTTRLLLSALLSVPFGLTLARGQSGVAEFDRIVSSEFKPGEPGGVILVARKGEGVYRKAFGMANVELDVPMREEMGFNIGSVPKPFPAVAVLQLAELGKLSLSDELTKHLPDYPTGGQKIPVENLLTHTAGIPGSAPEAITSLQGRKDLVGLQEII